MKQLILLLMMAIGTNMSAQEKGPVKLYGFRQAVSGGTHPGWNEGAETQQGKPGMNYRIYLESASRAYPVQMWIDGVEYGVSVKTVATPVQIKHANVPSAPAQVLVPKTAATVIQLVPNSNRVTSKRFHEGPTLAASHELVVYYRLNGKFYYNTLTELEQLPAAARQ